MYNILQHTHSGLMWLVVAMLLISVFGSLYFLISKKEQISKNWFGLFKYTKHLLYLQFLLGLSMLFLSEKVTYASGFMKNADLRFYGMEHPLMMLIAIGLVAWGLFKSKKKSTNLQKVKVVFIYYTIATIVILAMVPWSAVLG